MTPGSMTLLATLIATVGLMFLFEWALKGAEPRVSARYQGGAIVCHVPRDPLNRWLNLGILGYFSHGVQLNGLPNDPILSSSRVPALDCDGQDVVEGFCELFYGRDKLERATVNIPCFH